MGYTPPVQSLARCEIRNSTRLQTFVRSIIRFSGGSRARRDTDSLVCGLDRQARSLVVIERLAIVLRVPTSANHGLA